MDRPGARSPTHEIGELYLSRAARYTDMKAAGIAVIDPRSPRVMTMDPWPQMIFLMADGEHTVAQLITHLSSQYQGGAPPGLADQVRDIVLLLEREGVVQLHAQPKLLPPEFARPVAGE